MASTARDPPKESSVADCVSAAEDSSSESPTDLAVSGANAVPNPSTSAGHCRLPIELIDKIMDQLPRDALYNCLTINHLVSDRALVSLYRHLRVRISDRFPCIEPKYHPLFRHTKFVDILAHRADQCAPQCPFPIDDWNRVREFCPIRLLRMIYEEETEWFGTCVIRPKSMARLHPRESQVNWCPMLESYKYFKPETLVIRNRMLSMDGDRLDYQMSAAAPNRYLHSRCKEVIQVLLPHHLHNYRHDSTRAIPLCLDAPRCRPLYWVVNAPIVNTYLRTDKLILVNADAVWKHTTIDREKIENWKKSLDGFVRTVDYISMPEFLTRYPPHEYPVFEDDEIAGWLGMMEKGRSERVEVKNEEAKEKGTQ